MYTKIYMVIHGIDTLLVTCSEHKAYRKAIENGGATFIAELPLDSSEENCHYTSWFILEEFKEEYL